MVTKEGRWIETTTQRACRCCRLIPLDWPGQDVMNCSAAELNAGQRDVVLRAVQTVCLHRKWRLLAAHVRSSHVHVVVSAPDRPEKVMNDFKAYATRTLRKAGMMPADGKMWARHGSTRYLWNMDEISSAVEYVAREQGEPMAVFCGLNMV